MRTVIKVREDREHFRVVDEGELLLILTEHQGQAHIKRNPLLAVLNDSYDNQESQQQLILEHPAYHLFAPIRIDGKVEARVAPRNAWSGDLHSRRIVRVYVGKEDIMAYLTKRRWRAHVRWINALKKPYELPSVSTIKYVPCEKI